MVAVGKGVGANVLDGLDVKVADALGRGVDLLMAVGGSANVGVLVGTIKLVSSAATAILEAWDNGI